MFSLRLLSLRHVPLSKLFEDNPLCTNEPLESTIFVSEWPWDNQFTPLADFCEQTPDDVCPKEVGEERYETESSFGLLLHCYYEEAVYDPPIQTRWFEQEPGSELFKLIRSPVSWDDFKATEDHKWGRGPVISSMLGTDTLLPVTIEEEFGSEPFMVPRIVKLEIGYYQLSQYEKRLVEGKVSYMEGCTVSDVEAELAIFALRQPPVYPCESAYKDYNYTLEFSLAPLGYVDLLNKFQFSALVYLAFFILVGLLTVIIGAVIWGINRLITKLRHPPKFRFISLFKMVAPAPAFGVCLSSCLFLLAAIITLVWFFMTGSDEPVEQPSMINFEEARNQCVAQRVFPVLCRIILLLRTVLWG